MKKFSSALICCCLLIVPEFVMASGYGVFTQGAAGLGQANAVVAHPTGPSSAYFNPALLNDVPGRQIEIGTTAITADRKIKLASGGSEENKDEWNFPSTFYYTHEINDKFTAGLGIFFPFGLSNKWNNNYEGRYLGTSAEVLTVNINPVLSWRLNDRLSLAAGVSLVYLDATLESKINQTAAYLILQSQGAPLPPLTENLNDVSQKFEGDDWGTGFNFGMLYKLNDRISFGATFRSEIDIEVKNADVVFVGVNPYLDSAFPQTTGDADITLPAQVTAGLAVQIIDPLTVEVGTRWEDWNSTDELRIEFDTPVLGQTTNITPRDWRSTWTYNIGAQYQLNETVAINAGYLYGENAVPNSTFEPLIPDTDAHLFTIGTDLSFGVWTVSGAFAIEHHEDRDKNNSLGDPLGSLIAGQPTGTANGNYDSDIYLASISVGYKF